MAKEMTGELEPSFKVRLDGHPVYAAVKNVADPRCLMERHVFSARDGVLEAVQPRGRWLPEPLQPCPSVADDPAVACWEPERIAV